MIICNKRQLRVEEMVQTAGILIEFGITCGAILITRGQRDRSLKLPLISPPTDISTDIIHVKPQDTHHYTQHRSAAALYHHHHLPQPELTIASSRAPPSESLPAVPRLPPPSRFPAPHPSPLLARSPPRRDCIRPAPCPTGPRSSLVRSSPASCCVVRSARLQSRTTATRSRGRAAGSPNALDQWGS